MSITELQDQRADMRLLGELLQQWHASGGDPIYAAGSHLYAGVHPELNVCFDALRNLVKSHPDDDPAAAHLALTISLLIDYIQSRTL